MQKSKQLNYLQVMDIQVWKARHEAPDIGERKVTVEVQGDFSPEEKISHMNWVELEAAVANCKACDLYKTRTHSVFGVGNQQASLLIVGEAPGANEDKQGEPFVGRAGQLLNAMIHAIGLKREEIYIANILKSRPPNNRDPNPEEQKACTPYLLRQIALIKPKLILAVGRIAAQYLLKTEVAMGNLRGKEFTFGAEKTPLLVTYHPAYLLRSPREKRKAWQDMQLVTKTLARLMS